jgi:hypothetical protein
MDFVLGSMGQGIAMFLAGEMSRLAIDSSDVFKAPKVRSCCRFHCHHPHIRVRRH